MGQNDQPDNNRQIFHRFVKNRSNGLMSVVYLLPLASCGTKGGGPPLVQPPPALGPDFTESPVGTFTGRDNANLTLNQSGASNDLTVNSNAGNDTINTGSGNDAIKGGGGRDTINSGDGDDLILGEDGADVINGGAGNDSIVIVGLTSASQYALSDITNPGGSGTDLSSILTLGTLNGQTVSDATVGESINGGTGANTLILFGNVDLTGVTLSNLSVLQVNSDITMSPDQLSVFSTVQGDGASVLTLIDDPANNAFEIIDLSAIGFTGVASINLQGAFGVEFSSISDLSGIGALTGDGSQLLVLGDGGVGSILASDIAAVAGGFSGVVVRSGTTLVIDDPAALATLGITAFSGGGSVEIDSSLLSATTFSGISFDNNIVLVDENGGSLNPLTLGGTIIAGPAISISDAVAFEADGSATLSVSLSAAFSQPVVVDYTGPNGQQGTIGFAPGETTQNIVISFADNNQVSGSQLLNIQLSNSLNANIADGDATLTVHDDDLTTSFVDVGGNITGTISGATLTDTIGVELVAGQSYHLSLNPGDSVNGTNDPRIHDILDAQGNSLGFGDDDGGQGFGAAMLFTPQTSGTYYVLAGRAGAGSRAGTYELSVVARNIPPDDFSNVLDGSNPIAIWQTQDAFIEQTGDTDTIAVFLQAGVAVDITVYGNDGGLFGELVSPDILSFVDAGGTPINSSLIVNASAFQNLAFGVEQISFTPTVTGNYFITVGSASGTGVGDYSVSVAAMDQGIYSIRANHTPVLTGNAEVDIFFLGAELSSRFQNEFIVTDRNGDGTTTVTYSIPDANSLWSEADHNSIVSAPTFGFAPATGVVLSSFHAAISQIGSFSQISFVQVPDTGVQSGSFRVGTTLIQPSSLSGALVQGFSGFPAWSTFGETWINPTAAAANIAGLPIDLDNFLINRTLHEFTHNLGLNHPDRSSLAGAVDPMLLGQEYSVLSRTSSGIFPNAFPDYWPTTLMWLDIQAIQTVYGVDQVTTAGNDIYTFDTDARNFSTIWDFAGTDTIVLTGAADTNIDLTPGVWQDVGTSINYLSNINLSVVGTRTDTVFIAPGTNIENVEGGAGQDIISGSNVGNVLDGNAGNDTISGGGGNDTIIGGRGDDILSGGPGLDRFIYENVLDGADRINGFSTTEDQIDLDDLFDALGVAPANRDVVLTQIGGDVQLQIDKNNDGVADNTEFSILLTGVTLAQIGPDPVGDGLLVLSDI